LYAVRGQVVRVEKPAVDHMLFDPYGPAGVAYIVPRSGDAILGGTSEVGNEDMAPDTATTADIIRRCRGYGYDLDVILPIESLVGLRPCRPSVRVEAEYPASGRLLMHNYGHGGAGITLSFGCADEVASLVRHTQ
jgi:D-amino-acid oxidase